MPVTKITQEKLVAFGVEEIRRGNVFMLSEPHGDSVSVDISKQIMSMATGKDNKILLEAPIQMHNQTRRELEQFLSTTHTPRLKELPSHALKTGWGVNCVDGDFRTGSSVDIREVNKVGRYSQDRQAFIADNIKKVVKSTKRGCIVLYGRIHIQGKSPSTMTPAGIESFAQILTGTPYNQHTRYLLKSGKIKVYAQSLGRTELL